MAFVRNLKYPKDEPRTEEDINDYYNDRSLEIKSQYESRMRDINTAIYENDQKIADTQSYYQDNLILSEERARLLEDYERDTVNITELEKQYEIKNTRYEALDTLWAETEDPAERDRIKQEAISVYEEKSQIQYAINNAKEENAQRRQEYNEDDRALVRQIDSNRKRINKIQNIEQKQQSLVNKEKRLSDELEEDLAKNEARRAKELETTSVTKDIEFYAYGSYSEGGRKATLKITATITGPVGFVFADVPKDVLKAIAIDGWDYVDNEGENAINPSLMEFSESKPDEKGIYHFDDRKDITYTHDEVIDITKM